LSNPVKEVEKLRESYEAARFDFYSHEDIRKLVEGVGDPQDGTIYLTAAFSGLRRGELIGLLWEDIVAVLGGPCHLPPSFVCARRIVIVCTRGRLCDQLGHPYQLRSDLLQELLGGVRLGGNGYVNSCWSASLCDEHGD
jgi:hypothetical protein